MKGGENLLDARRQKVRIQQVAVVVCLIRVHVQRSSHLLRHWNGQYGLGGQALGRGNQQLGPLNSLQYVTRGEDQLWQLIIAQGAGQWR